jgi:hypothetical protein
MLQMLEHGLEMAVPDVAKHDASREAAKPDPSKTSSGVEIVDADGCCVLCGGGGADVFCTFPCPSPSSQEESGDCISICGCM